MSRQNLGGKNITEDARRLRVLMQQAAQSGSGSAADHGGLSGLSDDDHLQYMHLTTARTVSAQHTFDPTAAGAPFVLATNAQGQLVTGLNADQLDGLDSSSSPGAAAAILKTTAAGLTTVVAATVTGTLTVSGSVGSHLNPSLTDTYDLGSSTKLWRHGYLSELDAVVFAEQTVSLLGGWLIIGHDSGTLAADAASGDANIDFGKAMTVGDFVLFRAALKVEYVLITGLVAGTTYSTTRNLDGSGANDWPAGTPFLVLGQSSDGRIELNAYNTPRISMILQNGRAYNLQTEVLRIGDLNGEWGYLAETYGVAIGRYAAGYANITQDPTNGVRLRTHSTTKAQLQADGDVFIGTDVSAAATTHLAIFTNAQTYNGESVSAGDMLIGDNTAAKANIFWDLSAGQLKFRGGTTVQAYVDTDGSITWGAGAGVLSATGATIVAKSGSSTPDPINKIAYLSAAGGTEIGYLGAGVPVGSRYIILEATGGGTNAHLNLQATVTDSSKTVQVDISASDSGMSPASTTLTVWDTRVAIDTDLRIGGGLYVGATGTDPADDEIQAPNFRITAEGGYAIKLTAGEDLYQGEVVYLYTGAGAADLAVRKAPVDSDMPIGFVYADASSAASVWIVIAGIGYVKPEAGTTLARGYIIYVSAGTAGRVDQSATLPAVAQHNRECGHVLENGSGAGVVARAVIHFN